MNGNADHCFDQDEEMNLFQWYHLSISQTEDEDTNELNYEIWINYENVFSVVNSAEQVAKSVPEESRVGGGWYGCNGKYKYIKFSTIGKVKYAAQNVWYLRRIR